MKPTGIHVNKCLASLLICLTLLLSFLLPFTNAIAAPPGSGPALAPDLQGTTPLVIEGRVEQIISEMQPGGLITSRAIVAIDKVVQGTLQGSQVTIRYLGGTVGELTLVVSDEPRLAEEMHLRAKLTPDEDGDYRITTPDTDLTILEGGVSVAYVPTGEKWPAGSIPVPIHINANTDDIAGDGERTAVQNAMSTWTNASCSYFAYSYQVGPCTTGPLYDGVNCVSWSSASGGSTLGQSHWWYNASDEIIETDIIFYDGDHIWSTSPGTGEFDVESVALHELGHSLGLDHTQYADSSIVMYPSIGSGQTKRSLHTDDRNGVCVLYPGSSSPPDAPSGLTAAPVPTTQINLSWTDNSDNEDGFKIERSPDGGATWPWNTTVGPNVTSYPNTGLTCDQTYHYRVRAYNTQGDSGYSNTANAMPSTGYTGDTYEPDDDPSTNAKPVTVNGAAQHHNFHVANNPDWVKFTVTAGKAYTITTSNLDAGNDTVLELYNDADLVNWIQRNDDCNPPNRDSCINNWSTLSSGTYFIKMYNYYDQGGCAGYGYDLRVVDSSGGMKVYLPIILKNSQ